MGDDLGEFVHVVRGVWRALYDDGSAARQIEPYQSGVRLFAEQRHQGGRAGGVELKHDEVGSEVQESFVEVDAWSPQMDYPRRLDSFQTYQGAVDKHRVTQYHNQRGFIHPGLQLIRGSLTLSYHEEEGDSIARIGQGV